MKKFINVAMVVAMSFIVVGLVLSSCGGGGSQGNSNTKAVNSIIINPSGPIKVKRGSIQRIYLSLNTAVNNGNKNSSVKAVLVSSTFSDPNIAFITPEKCYLATDNSVNSRCYVTIYGKKNGVAKFSAIADGYNKVQQSVLVGDAIVFGHYEVLDRDGNWESASTESTNPTIIRYAAAGDPPYNFTLTAKLVGSSGIESVPANSNYAGTIIACRTGNPGSCADLHHPAGDTVGDNCPLTSTAPYNTCNVRWVTNPGISPSNYLSEVMIGGSVLAGHPATEFPPHLWIRAESDATPNYGQIEITSQSGNLVPFGLGAPVFVNWRKVAGIFGTVNITLSIQNPSTALFYDYAAQTRAFATSPTKQCTLIHTESGVGDQLSCGFSVYQLSSGSTTITGTAQFTPEPGTSGVESSLYVVNLPLQMSVREAPIRTLTYTNNTSATIWPGIVGGATAGYTDSEASPSNAVTNAKALTGAVAYCGPSDSRVACPIGSACIQGGANPESTAKFQCTWFTPFLGDGSSQYYKLEHGQSLSMGISKSNLSPNGTIWSGNTFPRTGCIESGAKAGKCRVGSCNAGTSGFSCGIGVGGDPSANTLSEMTFQTSVDFYDISIINGISFATEFGPANSPTPEITDSYSCGIAGNLESQNVGGYNLPASSWAINIPSTAVFSDGANAATYYRWVSNDINTQCTTDSECTNINPNYRCGYPVDSEFNTESNAVNKGPNSVYTRYCGIQHAWLTADELWGFNQSANNAAPFNFLQSWTVPGVHDVNVGNLQLCNNDTFSTYADPAPNGVLGNLLLACGGTNWDGLTVPVKSVVSINNNWVNNVLPTITWLKNACPTCYTFPFDDMSSTFTCPQSSLLNATSNGTYNINFSDLR